MAQDPHIQPEGVPWRARATAASALLDAPGAMAALWRVTEHPEHHAVAAHPLTWIVPPAWERPPRAVGLFSASFNPLTEAHEALVAAARAAGLDLVIWAMARVTVNKERVERATITDRLAQVRALLASTRGQATTSEHALALLGSGLYVDQARAVHAALAERAGLGTRLVILLGFDKVVQIFDPRYYEDRERALSDLFALAEIWVAPRAGEVERDLRALLAEPRNTPYAAHVRYLPLPDRYTRDSSTEARERAAVIADPARDALLQALLAPEGLALTALGPFAPVSEHPPDEYSVRQAWLRALARLPTEALARVGSLGALVRATRERLTTGTTEGMDLWQGLASGTTPEAALRWLHALHTVE